MVQGWDVQETKQMMGQSGAIIVIDVCLLIEYELNHVNKPISVPIPILENKTAWFKSISMTQVNVYYSAGSRSAITAQILIK